VIPAKSGITLGASIKNLYQKMNSDFLVQVIYTYCCFFSFCSLIASMLIVDDDERHR